MGHIIGLIVKQLLFKHVTTITRLDLYGGLCVNGPFASSASRVSSGGLAVKHPTLGANGHRFEPRKRSKPF